MRILLIGRTGQLGGDLLRNSENHEVVAPERGELDIARSDHIAGALAKYKPELVINCAAFHNVPLCEDEPELAFRINCVAVRDLAAACRDADARLITFSSDYVFGGEKRVPYDENDHAQPLQMYGITRLAGEHAALSTAPDHATIVRTCGLYGMSGARSKGGNFVDGRVADARAGKTIEMASEQTISPTSTHDLSKALLGLVDKPGFAPGIYHLVNEGQCTWYEFTAAIVEELGLEARVIPVNRGGKTGALRRPLYSALANNKARALGVTLPSWRDALKRYLSEKY